VACVHADWLEGLYVVPDQWGTGVADALHEWALDEARALGSSGCHLWVLEANARARRFYERRGWRENGRTRVVPFPPNPLDVGYSLDF
jgi:GNAT superfamily N-acetyltransferase